MRALKDDNSTKLEDFNLKSVLDLRLAMNSDRDDLEDFNFEIKLIEWNQQSLKFKMEFSDNQIISQGPQKDSVLITIKNGTFFQSVETG